MTHEKIEEIIDTVNARTAEDRIFIRTLTKSVKTAKVWESEPIGRSIDESAADFYLIYDENELCVGAVEDMGIGNLHAVTKSDCRGRGLMSAILCDVILPHLCFKGRTFQEAEICSPAGKRLAEKVGFDLVSDRWARIDLGQIAARDFPLFPLTPLAPERTQAVHDRIRRAEACLKAAQAGLRSRVAPTLTEQFDFAIYGVSQLIEAAAEWDFPALDPEPTLPPPTREEGDVLISRVYSAAAWLRFARDEADGRTNATFTEDLHKYARRFANLAENVQDELRHRHFLASLASRN